MTQKNFTTMTMAAWVAAILSSTFGAQAVPRRSQIPQDPPSYKVAPDFGTHTVSVSPTSHLSLKKVKNHRCLGSAGLEGNVFGFLIRTSNPEDYPVGLYNLSETDPELAWPYDRKEDMMRVGWVEDDKLCGIVARDADFQIYVYEYVEYDLLSGENLSRKTINLSQSNINCYFHCAALNEDDGFVYGYSISPSGSGISWTKAPAGAIEDAQEIYTPSYSQGIEEVCTALCYNIFDNRFYGVNTQHQFVKIDLKGNQTVLTTVPGTDFTVYNTGLTHSPKDNAFILNVEYNGGISKLYKVTLEENAEPVFTELSNYDAAQTFAFIVNPDSMYDPSLPARPSDFTCTLNNGMTSGSVSFLLPSKWSDGRKISGEVDYSLKVDGKSLSSWKGDAGTLIETPIYVERGWHDITVTASKDGNESRPAHIDRFFGKDTPCTPEDLYYAKTSLSWEKVTQGAHEGWLEPDQVRYHVYFDDQELENSPVETTTYDFEIPTGIPYGKHEFKVTADYSGYVSEPATLALICGDPLSLDVHFNPEEADIDLFRVISPDDHFSWVPQYPEEENPELWFFSDWHWEQKLNEWLIFPPIAFDDPDVLYEMSLSAALSNEACTREHFELYIGKNPTVYGMKQIMGEATPTKSYVEGGERFSTKFPLPQGAGTYYVAIRCTSDAGQWGLLVRDFDVRKTADVAAGVVAAPTEISVNAAEDHSLYADVTFTLPTTYLNGEKIEDGTEMDVFVIGAEIMETTGIPGEKMEITVPTNNGTNKLIIRCSLNGVDGQPAFVSVFTGEEIPGPVTNITASLTEDAMGLELHWDPPTKGINGGYINPANLRYKIFLDNQSISVDEAVSSYTLRLPDGAPQKKYYFGIVAYNEAGAPNDFNGGSALFGTPYAIPASENFEDGLLNLSPIVVYAGEWGIDDPSSLDEKVISENGYSLYCKSSGGAGLISLPRFSTSGLEDTVLELTMWNRTGSPTVRLLGMTHGMDDMEEIGILLPESNGGWTVARISLPDSYMDLQYIWLFLSVDFTGAYLPMIIDKYEVCGNSKGNGVETIAAGTPDARICLVENGIAVVGADGADIEVYSLTGMKVYSSRSMSEYHTISLVAGAYIVSLNGHTCKVIVK